MTVQFERQKPLDILTRTGELVPKISLYADGSTISNVEIRTQDLPAKTPLSPRWVQSTPNGFQVEADIYVANNGKSITIRPTLRQSVVDQKDIFISNYGFKNGLPISMLQGDNLVRVYGKIHPLDPT